MSVGLITNTPFDIEIIYKGLATGRYINRGTIRTNIISDTNYTPGNEPGTLFCLPELQFKFSVDKSIDYNTQNQNYETENLIYTVSKDHLTWDFGDGTTSDEYEPVHQYDTPGIYTISVIMYDNQGFPRKNPYTFSLNIQNYVPDGVSWSTNNYRSMGIDYVPASEPLELTLTRSSSWQSPKSYKTVTMYCSGSDSLPGEYDTYMQNKYAHLQKIWRFTKSEDDPIPLNHINLPGSLVRVSDMNSYNYTQNTWNDASNMLQPTKLIDIELTPTIMVLNPQDSVDMLDTVTIGTSAVNNVYFTDDTVKNYLSRDTKPVFIFASLSADRSSSGTVEVPTSVIPIKITYSPATALRLSTNGIPSFKLCDSMYYNSVYNINVALINSFDNIIKTDYPELQLEDTTQTTAPVNPFSTHFSISNNTVMYSSFPGNLSKKPTAIETRGSANYLVELTDPLDNQEQLSLHAQVYVSDPAFCPIDTMVHALTNMYTPTAHFITPGYADASFSGGGQFETEADNTFVANVNTASLSASVSQNQITNASFAVCVDPVDSYVYIGDQTNDTVLKYDRFMNQLNDQEPIKIIDLICESNILNTSRFNYIDEKHFSTGESTLLDSLIGAREDNVPGRFETDLDNTCDRYNQNISERNCLSPSSICCDQNRDIWVTLIDGVLTVKLKSVSDLAYIVTAVAIPKSIESTSESQASLGLLNRSSSGEYMWMPSKVVADMNNDIWVSYTNQENIKLIKYNGSGVVDQSGETTYPMNQIAEISFPKHTHLDDMVIDSSNNLWVCDSTSLYTKLDADGEIVEQNHGRIYHIANDNRARTDDTDRIIHVYDSYSKQTTSVLFDKPSTMTFDLSDFLYVATNGNEIVRINPGTGECEFSFSAGSKYEEVNNDDFSFFDSRGQVTSIDAMSCDSDNSLLIVNNADRKLYTYRVPVSHELHPEHTDGENYIYEWFTDSSDRKFLQGSGDWTGIRWIQTYLKTVMGQRTLSTTHHFSANTLEQNEILKINEDHDAAGTLMDYTLQETINTKNNLLEWFISTIVGDSVSPPDTLGKTIYEKISNFVSNNNDVDLCNAKNLFSMATELGVDIKSYNYTYPGSIQRLVDILSIRYSKLFGSRDYTGLEFNKDGYANNFNHGRNIGSQPLQSTNINDPASIPYTVQVGTRLVAKELYNGTFTLIEPMAIDGDATNPNYSNTHGGVIAYPLSAYSEDWNWGLSHPEDESVFVYYDFYEYVPDGQPTTQMEGIINWGDDNITIDENTTFSDWSKSGGVVESLFDKKIRIGIGVTN